MVSNGKIIKNYSMSQYLFDDSCHTRILFLAYKSNNVGHHYTHDIGHQLSSGRISERVVASESANVFAVTTKPRRPGIESVCLLMNSGVSLLPVLRWISSEDTSALLCALQHKRIRSLGHESHTVKSNAILDDLGNQQDRSVASSDGYSVLH